MEPYGKGRILFDISSSMRAVGPPTGIVRVEREFAFWAYAHVRNCVFVFFDPGQQAYCELACDARQFLIGEAAVDTLGLTNPALPGRRRTDQIPVAFKAAFLWISQTRRMTLNRLEQIRLRTESSSVGRLADWLQRRLMSRKYRTIMIKHDHTRRAFYPVEMVTGPAITFAPNDTLVCLGAGWAHTNIAAISKLKARIGFSLALFCHDLIPVKLPEFYRDHEVKVFDDYFRLAFAIADCIVANSRAVESDCRTYCAQRGIAPNSIILGFLGCDFRVDRSNFAARLPANLRAGQFALLVSTIEPRKGHALLYRVWKRLLADGVPQATGFKLVFVGRMGWMVDELLAKLRKGSQTAEHIEIIHDADDTQLTILYRKAAFCIYPSVYEGYGLPIIEAFSHGRAVLASNGGALPETSQGFCPSLDPLDEQAWYDAIKQWIVKPQARVCYETRIREHFRHPTWSDAAANFFANISTALTSAPKVGKA